MSASEESSESAKSGARGEDTAGPPIERGTVTFPPALDSIVERSSRKRQGRYAREDVRTNIALMLIVVFGIMNVAMFGILLWDQSHGYDWKPLKELAELLFPALTALIGSVIGFYFASNVGEDQKL